MQLISDADWNDYKSLIGNDAFDTFGQATIIWRRAKSPGIDRFKEDGATSNTEDIPLKCLVNYNYMRSWPITSFATGESGELNEQSIQVLFSKNYLQSLGYVNADGLFSYLPDFDRFLLDGLIRKPVGDSSVSQAKDGSMIFEVIMVEQSTKTGKKRM